MENIVFKISKSSNPSSVAGAIAGEFRDKGAQAINLHAIGAGAINQAVKAVAIARGYVAPNGINLVCTPAFMDVVVDDDARTGIKLIVTK